MLLVEDIKSTLYNHIEATVHMAYHERSRAEQVPHACTGTWYKLWLTMATMYKYMTNISRAEQREHHVHVQVHGKLWLTMVCTW